MAIPDSGSRLKVAHVITRLCNGGAQENTLHTVRLLDPAKYKVDLISGPIAGPGGSIEEQVQAMDIEVIRVPELIRDPSPAKDWAALRRLRRIFRQNRYDIVHTHTSKAGYLGRIAAAQAGVPYIAHTPHGHVFHSYFDIPTTWFFIALERHAAGKTNRIIGLTRREIEDHLQRGIGAREQYAEIFSGVDMAPYQNLANKRADQRAELGVSEDDVLVGGVGRLETVKGFTYFVDAARQLAQAHSRCQFVIVGDGSLRRHLEESTGNIRDRFRFLGWRNDVPAVMAALDVLVAPSLNEGMGRVVVEAGAAGTPVVASRVGGIPDLIDHDKTGILVEPRDAAAVAQAVSALIADPEKRRALGAQAREKMFPAYSLQNMVQRIEALYEEMVYGPTT